MDLRDAMWEASEAPPPTAIDVDRLITGERRRTRGLRLAGVAAGVTVLAFGATMLPRYFGESLAPPAVAAGSPGGSAVVGAGTPGSVPSGVHSMTTWPPCDVKSGGGEPPLHPVTETCGEATTRLAAVFGGNFQGVLGNDWPTPRFVRVASMNVAYLASWDYSFKGHVFHLNVYLYANPKDKAEWADATCDDGTCHRDTVNGLPVLISDGPRVSVSRPDGTEVAIDFEPAAGGAYVPPVTEAQAIQLATAPEMTLYPVAR